MSINPATVLATIDRQIASQQRDLCGCRNKYVKDRINREIARLQARKAALLGSAPVSGAGDGVPPSRTSKEPA